ncbi:YjbQ family protein [Candidatus Pacearchaeota archaeon]|nr:YjbQ family protein [Candidatus Pacearchaeota archaeon]
MKDNSISIKTNKKEELIDITSKIKKLIKKENLKNGLINIFVKHTTAGITINENADPDVKDDILKALGIFDRKNYKHAEGNSPAHVKSSLLGSSVTVPVKKGKMQLGTWQGIMFAEFDGPRNREVVTEIISYPK